MKVNLEKQEIRYNLYDIADGDILMVRVCDTIHPILYKDDSETDCFFVICLNENKFAKKYNGEETTLEDVLDEWRWKLVEIIPSEEIELRRVNK